MNAWSCEVVRTQKSLASAGMPVRTVCIVVSGTNSAVPFSCWCGEMPITRKLAGPEAVWTVMLSPSRVPVARAMACSMTATWARACSSAGVYQRPAAIR